MSWNEKLTRVNAKSFEAIVVSNSTKKKTRKCQKKKKITNGEIQRAE